jgi:hypothetical protein
MRPLPLTQSIFDRVLDSEGEVASKRLAWKIGNVRSSRCDPPAFVRFFQEAGLAAYVLHSEEQREQIKSAYQLSLDLLIPTEKILELVGLPPLRSLPDLPTESLNERLTPPPPADAGNSR